MDNDLNDYIGDKAITRAKIDFAKVIGAVAKQHALALPVVLSILETIIAENRAMISEKAAEEFAKQIDELNKQAEEDKPAE